MIDGRSDIYSLAALTYEMLTGEPPHTGNTAQAIIARVLTETPRPIRTSRSSVPEHVEFAVARALEKLPADRWSTAAQFAEVLQGRSTSALAEPAMLRLASSGARGGRAHTTRERLVAMAPWLVALSLAIVATVGLLKLMARSEPTTTRFTLSIPVSQRFVPIPGRQILFSPDGRSVIYGGRSESGGLALYEYPLDQLSPRVTPGAEVGADLFISPDGRRVGGSYGPDVKTFPMTGGGATTLASVELPRGNAWSRNGQIIVASISGLVGVSATGGPVEQLTEATSPGERPRYPLALADGKTILFQIDTRADTSILGVLRLDTKKMRRVEGSIANAIGMVDGWLIFGRSDGSIMAAPFDPATTSSLPEAVQLLDGVRVGDAGVSASLSNDGSLVYLSAGSRTGLAIVDEHGAIVTRFGERRMGVPVFSPDGQEIAFVLRDPEGDNQDIWVYNISSRVTRRITTWGRPRSDCCSTYGPSWTADGKRIAFVAEDSLHKRSLMWVPADKSGPEELFLSHATAFVEAVFSPDGKYAVLRSGGFQAMRNRSDLWLLPLAGGRKPVPLLNSAAADEFQPAISHDSRWLAYVSNESGENQVYVRPLLGGASVPISPTGGAEPQWANDGRLLYRVRDSLVAATLSFAPSVTVQRQQPLIAMGSLPGIVWPGYSIHPNGKQFVFYRAESDLQVVVVMNWATELREKLRKAGKQ